MSDEDIEKIKREINGILREAGYQGIVMRFLYSYSNDEGHGGQTVVGLRKSGTFIGIKDATGLEGKTVKYMDHVWDPVERRYNRKEIETPVKDFLSNGVHRAFQVDLWMDDDMMESWGSYSHEQEYDDEGGYRTIDRYEGHAMVDVRNGEVVPLDENMNPRSHPSRLGRWVSHRF